MCSRPRAPQMPDLPPPRAMERLPQRGMVASDARRQITAGMGTDGTASGATVLGPAGASGRRQAGGATGSGQTILGSPSAAGTGGRPASVAQANPRAATGSGGGAGSGLTLTQRLARERFDARMAANPVSRAFNEGFFSPISNAVLGSR